MTKKSTQASKKQAGKSIPIVVLTYNVLHEIDDPVKHNIKPCENDACIRNVCKFIDRKAAECDFIGIQEYSNIGKLTEYSKKLHGMGHSHTVYKGNLLRYGPITFYDTAKHTLDGECSSMKFGFGGKLGRGIQINFFNGGLCVINVHAGHTRETKINTFEDSLDAYLNGKYCDETCKTAFIKKLQEYAIIMFGDMNDEMVNDFLFTVGGTERKLTGRTMQRTCCGNKRTMDGNNHSSGAYDHILSTLGTFPKGATRVYTGLRMHSDHNPVKSTLRG
jgi:endonuclease/exonuclease/phosphatase family metal-dependent hydrolase